MEPDRVYNEPEVLQYCKMECLGLSDDYSEEPFEEIGAKMENLTPDGKVKKRIIREGYGDPPEEGSEVVIDYNAYTEFNDTPFDSTYIREEPKVFTLGSGTTILGIDIGVRSMKLDEKAQFLFHCDYAFGHMGCFERIPPKSTVLFEIELKKIMNVGAIASYNSLPTERQKEFSQIYRYAQAACVKAKELVNKNIKAAIREYNIVSEKLETCEMQNIEEEEKQQQLLLRIYTNLMVCHNKVSAPKKACTAANKIFYMAKGTKMVVPTKVYFHQAKAYRMLGEYERAAQRLKIAQRRDPHNTAIAEEFVSLEKERKEAEEKEKSMARAMINSNDNNNKEDVKKVNSTQ